MSTYIKFLKRKEKNVRIGTRNENVILSYLKQSSRISICEYMVSSM